MSSRTKLIAGAIAVTAVAAGGAAFAAVRLAETAAPVTLSRVEQSPFGNGMAGAGLGNGRLGGRGFGGGLGPGGFRGGFFHAGASSAGIAAYLGLSAAQLQADLLKGQTLAQIARAQGKTVAGLVALMVGHLKKRLDSAVTNGFLTQAQANVIAATLEQRMKDAVNGVRPRFGLGAPPSLGGA